MYSSTGHCIYHPSIRLCRIDGDRSSWQVERKICPKCKLNSMLRENIKKERTNNMKTIGGACLDFDKRSKRHTIGDIVLEHSSMKSLSPTSLSTSSVIVETNEELTYHTQSEKEIRKEDPVELFHIDHVGDVQTQRRKSCNRQSACSPSRSLSLSAIDPPAVSLSPSSNRRLCFSDHHITMEENRKPPPKMSPKDASIRSKLEISTSAELSLGHQCHQQRSYQASNKRKMMQQKKRPLYHRTMMPPSANNLRGRDPEECSESTSSKHGRSASPNGRVPRKVHVIKRLTKDNEIILIGNIPQDVCQDDFSLASNNHFDRSQFTSENSKEKRNSKKGQLACHVKLSERRSSHRSRSHDEYCPRPRRRSSTCDYDDEQLESKNFGSDLSSSFQPSSITSLSCYSIKSGYTQKQICLEIDAEGYCIQHPDVQLRKPKKGREAWIVVRKKCPMCIRECCSSSLDEVERKSIRSNQNTHSTSNHSSSADYSHLSVLQKLEEIQDEETQRLIRRLAARAYHFPGNSWLEDLVQHFSNTHTILGIFFHHPLHPLKVEERLVILFGSIAIGFSISNLTYLYFIWNGFNIEAEVFRINCSFIGLSDIIMTKLMITQLTLGSFLHTLFDLGLWHVKACTLCRYRGEIDDHTSRWGRVIGLVIVVIVIAAGTYGVLLRASIEYKDVDSEGEEGVDNILRSEFYEINFDGKQSFHFLLGYLLQFLVALFVFNPITVTTVFSGLLGCGGRVPILGGRPREIKKEMKYKVSKNSCRILNIPEMNVDGAVRDDERTQDAFSGSSYDDCHVDEIQII